MQYIIWLKMTSAFKFDNIIYSIYAICSPTTLNFELFLFLDGLLTKAQKSSLSHYLLIARKKRRIYAFAKDISVKRNENSLVQDLN